MRLLLKIALRIWFAADLNQSLTFTMKLWLEAMNMGQDGYWKSWNKLLSWAQRCGAEVQLHGRTKYGAVQCRRFPAHSITIVVPPLINQQKKSCRVWESRPLEHGSTLHGEAWRINFFHVLYFDLIKYPKSGLWSSQYFGLKSSKVELFSIRKLFLKAYIKMLLEMSPKVHVLVSFWPKDAFAKFVCSCLLLKMFLLMRETGWYHKWLPSHASCRIKSSQSVLPSQLQIFFVFPPKRFKKAKSQQIWSSTRLEVKQTWNVKDCRP